MAAPTDDALPLRASLGVVFQLALAFESGVERLAGISVAVAIRFQQTPATVR